MYKETDIRLTPADARDRATVLLAAAAALRVHPDRILAITPVRQSIDARHPPVIIQMRVGVHVDAIETPPIPFTPAYRDVARAAPVIIIGAGPAGLFAALRLIERGRRPVILERGKPVEQRRADLRFLHTLGIVSDDSNYGFGEGGAGAFSDGKLFTRSTKRGDTSRVLGALVHHGASPAILVDAHPHVGTDKLPGVMTAIRRTIEASGGQVLFNHRVTELLLHERRLAGVIANGREHLATDVILATGHSARDIYRLLHRHAITLLPKEFAVGLRLEHPREFIDRLQYHHPDGRGQFLPPAEYTFTARVHDRGVYTFCMCPGGVILPAATGARQQVVNGMSSSARNSPWSNAAIVTTIGTPELALSRHTGTLGGLEFQEHLEEEAWNRGNCNLMAPAQRLPHFIAGRDSADLPRVSYRPGVIPSPLHAWLPSHVADRLRQGLAIFGRKAPGFITSDAVLLGVETRTSSPLRVPRDPSSLQHPDIAGLYPCGEGAGYAGGIVSAAMDGEAVANAIT